MPASLSADGTSTSLVTVVLRDAAGVEIGTSAGTVLLDTPNLGTLGAVKGVTPQELAAAGASVMLSNLYHLALRPGVDAVERLGGIHAFELLIDRHSGAVYPEPGPNMMWNTKYGHMGGMMGGRWRAIRPSTARRFRRCLIGTTST